ncbi:MAG: chemotaxis protein CheW [Colwellia sp.]|nr:chemotaxis protein CheW [Colwellia sp.]
MNTFEEKNTEKQTINETQQFLTFTIADEHFGMELHQTREIIEYAGITKVPLMPQFITGVINLRGEVVPVIDLSVRLGREPITIHKRTCVIVIELNSSEQNCVLGLLADAVNEVIDICAMDIEDAPAFGAKIRAEFIQGIAKKDDDFIVLLDAEKTLSPRELAHLVEAELQ